MISQTMDEEMAKAKADAAVKERDRILGLGERKCNELLRQKRLPEEEALREFLEGLST